MYMAGYSHRTLRDKLEIKPGMRLYFYQLPHDVAKELGDLDDDTTIVHDEVLANYFHYFISTMAELCMIAETIAPLKAPGQIVWISWPKKSSKVKSELTEQDLRDILLPTGLVDTKVATVSDIYSGLKFVWRKK
jgi:hypothetical protein